MIPGVVASSAFAGAPAFAYPLNATLAQLEALTGSLINGLLTLSNVNQTGTYTVVGAPSQANNYGMGSPTAQALDASTGKKAIQFNVNFPANASGPDDITVTMALLSASTGKAISILCLKYNIDSSFHVVVLVNNAGAGGVTGLSWGAHEILIECDATGSGVLIVKVDGTPITLSSNAYTPESDYQALSFTTEATGSSSSDAGLQIVTTLVSAYAGMSNVDAGYTDFGGNS